MMHDTINRLESQVRSYCRSFPTVFTRAEGHLLHDTKGRRYLDFFAGAGALNYGHNNPQLRSKLVEYLQSGGIAHSLDMATGSKVTFLELLESLILRPRNLDYKVMFPGPTGTNAVEAAIKLARKVTERSTVVAFTNAFHGMTLGSLALTGNSRKRAGAGVDLGHVVRMPYAGFLGESMDTLDYLEAMLADTSSGVDLPAAFILETLQGEGGLNQVSRRWLERLARIAHKSGSLLIVDDIQVGCGRTGPFFSFETLGVTPDIVCLSKSLSGFGLPLSLVLIRPEFDKWAPGEHNGTFRGNNLAFVTAAAALRHYWSDDDLEKSTLAKSRLLGSRLRVMAKRFGGVPKGRGMLQGVSLPQKGMAQRVCKEAFDLGLIVETSGSNDEVLKVMPPLTVDASHLEQGLDLLERAAAKAIGRDDEPKQPHRYPNQRNSETMELPQ